MHHRRNSIQALFGAILVLLCHAATWAGQDTLFADTEALLPPLSEWHGASEALAVDAEHPWVTPAERNGLQATPSYEETVAWLQKLVAAAPELAMVSIGKSLQGRDFWMVIASAEGHFTAAEMKASGKPLLLAQAGIHSGEIDGKDAGLMLLRDLTVAKRRPELLAGSNLLFVPIFNVDGHERVSPYSRINQRGPREMGWRTNARNQNFNRDYAKLDTPGVRAIVEVINQWEPDLYLDLHVTDGVDYQYDITFGGNGHAGWSPAVRRWINQVYFPAVAEELTAQGHVPGPLVLAVNDLDLEQGFQTWTAGPRYSNGYGDARHLPAVLVENHSLKPYRQRVLGTYVLLASSMAVLAQQQTALRGAVASDRALRPDQVDLGFQASEDPPEQVPFKGIAAERYTGKASGGAVVRWTGQPDERPVPAVRVDRPLVTVRRPEAYIIPPEWADIARRIAMHGITVETLGQAVTQVVEVYRLPQARMAQPEAWTPNPFEGRVRIDPGKPAVTRTEKTLPAGSFRVSTDQPLAELLMLLLEPEAPDSFFQWGFFLEIFTRTEYAEAYVMEPLARKMLAADPELAAQFEARLASDPEFAADPARRLMWFYERTPYYDPQYLVYPVVRVPR
ncbi:MAG TPA: M14 family metallopeptidase [Xanthomonadales bacterium]|nr:M14 family metallopeptidase [Xanthomonadales bacterium]